MLNFSNHVVLEVADQTAVQRWQIVKFGRVIVARRRSRRKHAFARVDGDPEITDHPSRSSCDTKVPWGRRPTTTTAPAVTVVDRLEEKAFVADDGKGSNRRGEVGQHLAQTGTTVCWPQGQRTPETRPDAHHALQVSGSVTVR